MPGISELFLRFSPVIYEITGGAALAFIGILWLLRKTAVAAVLSVGIFAACAVFHVVALWALDLPVIWLADQTLRLAQQLHGQ
jgi:hypothetical protein